MYVHNAVQLMSLSKLNDARLFDYSRYSASTQTQKFIQVIKPTKKFFKRVQKGTNLVHSETYQNYVTPSSRDLISFFVLNFIRM